MAGAPDKWLRHLTLDQIEDLIDAAARVEASGAALEDITAGQYRLPSLENDISEWRETLLSGAGMVLVRGLPVRKIGKARSAIIYWLVGLYLGQPVPQNASGETLVDIRDTGSSAKNLKTFEYPIVTREDNIFRMMLLIWYIRNAAIEFPDKAALSPDEIQMLELLESVPEEDGMALDMTFQEGDMQFLKNAVVLHARSNYEDPDDPEEKRHLLRLWLADKTLEDGDDTLRHAFPEAVK